MKPKFLVIDLLREKNINPSPGYSHANIVGQGDDGGNCYGEYRLCTEVFMLPISVANDQSHKHQRQQVFREHIVKEKTEI